MTSDIVERLRKPKRVFDPLTGGWLEVCTDLEYEAADTIDRLSRECEAYRTLLRQSERAMSAMLTGISVHNGLHADALARRNNIEGEVVSALARTHALVRNALLSKDSGDECG